MGVNVKHEPKAALRRRAAILAMLAAGAIVAASARPSAVHAVSTPSPIKHVVIVYQENHSFDNVLGKLCSEIDSGQITGHDACDGATTGTLADGTVIPLRDATDTVPGVVHNVASQQGAIDGGSMDGFSKLTGCQSPSGYACYSQYDPTQIPNLSALAERFVIADRTFEFASTPSWGGHLVLAAATLDGFSGDNPIGKGAGNTVGWGCDSGLYAWWWNGSEYTKVPACIPDAKGAGPFKPSPVAYVPTIFDRLDRAHLTWKIYGGIGRPGSGYGWTICPSFYECLGSGQRANLVPAKDFPRGAQRGKLPSFSIVTPTMANSQHNDTSMATGDNWIGQVVSAVEKGPDWGSTAIFIAYDDCGCFYDHVPPPSSTAGIRVPMVIVSPYARAGYTDSTGANLLSMLAFTEHNFGLAPLTSADANAYDFSNAFDYGQAPLPAVKMTTTRIPASERAWLAKHPPAEDDPT
jgi:phospholipase C